MPKLCNKCKKLFSNCRHKCPKCKSKDNKYIDIDTAEKNKYKWWNE